MMKEGTGGRNEEDGDRNATTDGRKIICPTNGMTSIRRGAAAYGPGYCCF